jgi:hypothetical protein
MVRFGFVALQLFDINVGVDFAVEESCFDIYLMYFEIERCANGQ